MKKEIKRIIPCLDVKGGRVVKGVNFENVRDVGDIVEFSVKYSKDGADELIFLDITASEEQRNTRLEWVEQVARAVTIPFIVGGGVASEKDVEQLLKMGAAKVSINSAALREPELIDRLSKEFGRESIVVAIDAGCINGYWQVFGKGGKMVTGRTLLDWADEVVARGAGEVLFTSIDHDGTNGGFACEATALLSDKLPVPVIASGGAGSYNDFLEVFTTGKADAALAAGVFHFGVVEIPKLKSFLDKNGVLIKT